jgi:hypothetical protein
LNKTKSRPQAGTSLFSLANYPLGGAALPVQIFVVLILALAALFLLSGLPALLPTLTWLSFLAGLAWLVALLSRLSTLLSVLFHIVCHEVVLPSRARGSRTL